MNCHNALQKNKALLSQVAGARSSYVVASLKAAWQPGRQTSTLAGRFPAKTPNLAPARMMSERHSLPLTISPQPTSLFALCLMRKPRCLQSPHIPCLRHSSPNTMECSRPHFHSGHPAAGNAFFLFLANTSSSSKTHHPSPLL